MNHPAPTPWKVAVTHEPTRRAAPPEPVHDGPRYPFDHHAEGFAHDPWSTYRELRERCPVAWSDRYDDGFWVVSRYADVQAVAMDDAGFSSDREVVLPATRVGRIIPLNADPPDLTRYRHLLNPWFARPAIERLETEILAFTTERIDAFIETGRCDLVTDLANPVPAMTTLALIGLPVEEWHAFAEPIHRSSYHRAGHPERDAATVAIGGLRGRMRDELAARRRAPREDLLTGLVRAEAEGTIDAQEAEDLAVMVLIGGVDTTMAALSSAFLRIQRDPALRERLIGEPALLGPAIEELLRVDPPVQGFARTVTRGCVVGGQAMAAGETLFMLWGAANRDPEAFPDPDAVRVDRSPNRHLTFGIGGHRCLGATLARAEMRIVLTEVLRRLPDFAIDEAGVELPDTIGIVNGIVREPATFTPGPRIGA